MASMDSSLAESMNAQVLTMSTSASSASLVISMPWASTPPSMISASTRFFAQPREIMPIFFGLAIFEDMGGLLDDGARGLISNGLAVLADVHCAVAEDFDVKFRALDLER